MSSAPPPSTLTLLSELPKHDTGTKVRFLGCVTSYDTGKGLLELQHAHPAPPDCSVAAHVDINLLLENTKRENLEVGAWVNIVGYVQNLKHPQPRIKAFREAQEVGSSQSVHTIVQIQAIMLWSAGGIKINEYEKAVTQRTAI